MTVNILGTLYTIKIDVDPEVDKELDGNFGYCDMLKKEIVIADLTKCGNWKNEPQKSMITQNKVTMRHEIIHAYLAESGLRGSSNDVKAWALNKEMVDLIALQFPKILKSFKEVKAI